MDLPLETVLKKRLIEWCSEESFSAELSRYPISILFFDFTYYIIAPVYTTNNFLELFISKYQNGLLFLYQNIWHSFKLVINKFADNPGIYQINKKRISKINRFWLI